jgi:cytochrome P450/nitrite reductase/ring-hydroxylating ferredoxin subunit
MKFESFVRVAKLDELAGAGPFAVSAKGVDVALVRTGAGWRAFQGHCPHQGALLGEGEIEGEALVCRNHRWRFSVASGQREGGPQCLASCPVVERDVAVFVDVSGLTPASLKPAATRSLDELPGPKPLPVLGNLHQTDPTRFHLILEAWAGKYGPLYQFRMRNHRIVATSDPDLIEEVLRARPETFRRGVKFDGILTELGIKGVFNAEGDAWRPQRKLAVAALAQRTLRQLYPHIATVAGRLEARWRRAAALGETLDVVEELKRFTVDVTMLIVFGHDANTLEQSGDVIERDLEIFFPAVNRRIFALFPTWRYIRTPASRRLDRALQRIRAWLDELIAKARANIAADPMRAQRPANFLEAMLTTVDEEGQFFSDDVIMSNLITMLLAGEDTTAFTLAWAMHELCDDPRWAREVRREGDAILGEAGVADTLDASNRLALTSAVVNEVMRLRPVGPVAISDANVDTALAGYFIPKGTSVASLLRPAALDPKHFVDPLAFRPERWLEGLPGPHDAAKLMPFGSGPRMCPGRSLALIEMRTVLSMLCKAFDMERVGDSKDVAELYGVTMSPAGLRVRLRPRAAAAG